MKLKPLFDILRADPAPCSAVQIGAELVEGDDETESKQTRHRRNK